MDGPVSDETMDRFGRGLGAMSAELEMEERAARWAGVTDDQVDSRVLAVAKQMLFEEIPQSIKNVVGPNITADKLWAGMREEGVMADPIIDMLHYASIAVRVLVGEGP